MENAFDIAQVTERTGLTARALRFYEARGLVKPLRTASGRRVYGPAELERISQILALKRAGLTLAQIQRLTERRPLDLKRLIAAQIEAVEARAAELAEARALLLSVQSRIDRGEPIDAATFCSLIRNGDAVMESENWKRIGERYLSADDRAEWEAARVGLPADFDQEAYARQWSELGAKVEAALLLDPASAEAQALFDEWQALLAPFTAVATPRMMQGASNFYERMDEWKGEQKPPFSMEVWKFIQAAGQARKQA